MVQIILKIKWYKCYKVTAILYLIHTVYFHHKFSVITWRASNERPYGIVRTITTLRSGIICFFDITNYLHELGTAARRAGVQWTPLPDCANGCNITLGHDMFLTLQTIFTNWERWLTVKLSRPRQCMRCRGRFGFTRGFRKLSYWNQLFLGVLLL